MLLLLRPNSKLQAQLNEFISAPPRQVILSVSATQLCFEPGDYFGSVGSSILAESKHFVQSVESGPKPPLPSTSCDQCNSPLL